MISGLVDKVTGRSQALGLAMSVAGFDPQFAMQQHAQVYGGGMRNGMVGFRRSKL